MPTVKTNRTAGTGNVSQAPNKVQEDKKPSTEINAIIENLNSQNNRLDVAITDLSRKLDRLHSYYEEGNDDKVEPSCVVEREPGTAVEELNASLRYNRVLLDRLEFCVRHAETI